MVDYNPYAPPTVDTTPEGVAPQPSKRASRPRGYRRVGDFLVVRDGARLPAKVCLRTGKRSDGVVERRVLRWVSGWVFALLFFPLVGALLVLLGYFAYRRRIDIHCALSPEARAAMRNANLIAITITLAGLLLIAVVGTAHGLAAVGFLMIVTAPLIAIRLRRPCRVHEIEGDEAYLIVKPAVFEALGLSGPQRDAASQR